MLLEFHSLFVYFPVAEPLRMQSAPQPARQSPIYESEIARSQAMSPRPRVDLLRSPTGPYQPPSSAPYQPPPSFQEPKPVFQPRPRMASPRPPYDNMSPRSAYEDPPYLFEQKASVESRMPTRSLDEVDSARSETLVHTVLFSQSTGPFLTYQRVPWQLHLRKEVQY